LRNNTLKNEKKQGGLSYINLYVKLYIGAIESMYFHIHKHHINKRNILHGVFILIILYAVSSINVLALLLGSLHHFQFILLETNILNYFAFISVILAVSLSVYHLSIMFRNRKRKTDTVEEQGKIGFKEMLCRSRPLSKTIFVLICLYILTLVYMLLWTRGIVKNILRDYEILWLSFSLFSFGITAVTAAYHLATWILRQKRISDHSPPVQQ
jgi:hypothetical protein